MHQTLFYIPPALFGLPVFGTGLLFGLVALVTVAAVLVRLFRHGWKWDRDCESYLLLGGLAAAVIVFVAPKVMSAEGFPIRGYGLFLLLAIVCAFGLLYWRMTKKRYFSADLLFQMAIWAVICGILGARIFYVAEYWPQMQAVDPATGKFSLLGTLGNLVNVAEGGLVVYGSILGGTAAVIGFLLWHRLPVLKTLDLMTPSLLLGMAIGRIGCLMNGCCFGGVCEDPHQCTVTFPPGSPAHYHQVEQGLVPLQGLIFEDDGQGHVTIRSVVPKSQAEQRGLRAGMPVVGIGWVDGSNARIIPVASRQQAGRLLLEISLGSPVMIRFGCNGRPLCVCPECAERQRTAQSPLHDPTAGALPVEKICIATAVDRPAVILEQRDKQADGPLPVYPTQVYSSIGNFVLFLLLLGLSQFKWRDGIVFSALLLLYPPMRFLLEIVRDDEPSFLGTGLTVSQNVSIVLFVGGLILLIYSSRLKNSET